MLFSDFIEPVRRASFIICVILVISGCNNAKKNNKDVATKGSLAVSIDPAFFDLIKEFTTLFRDEYPQANIYLIKEVQEKGIIRTLNNDKQIRLVISSRKFLQAEKSTFEERNFEPHQILLGKDALVLLTSKSNKVESLSMDELLNLSNSGHELIVEGAGSSGYTYLDSVIQISSSLQNVSALESDSLILDFLENKKTNKIGLISLYRWRKYFNSNNNKTNIKSLPLRVRIKDTLIEVRPSQTTILDGTYPLSRNIYGILNEPYSGLGRGMVNYIKQERLQRVFLKAGLAPAKMPARLIKFTN